MYSPPFPCVLLIVYASFRFPFQVHSMSISVSTTVWISFQPATNHGGWLKSKLTEPHCFCMQSNKRSRKERYRNPERSISANVFRGSSRARSALSPCPNGLARNVAPIFGSFLPNGQPDHICGCSHSQARFQIEHGTRLFPRVRKAIARCVYI